MNFAELAIQNGFIPDRNVYHSKLDLSYIPYYPNDNWFGVCTYYPDVILKKDNKKIHLSLQGFSMPQPNPVTDEWLNVAKSMGCKYLALVQDGKILYETYYGNLPDEQFIKDFILS